jgi:hypothetical protein
LQNQEDVIAAYDMFVKYWKGSDVLFGMDHKDTATRRKQVEMMELRLRNEGMLPK